MFKNFLKNIFVVGLGLACAYLGMKIDMTLNLQNIITPVAVKLFGVALVIVGFVIRTSASRQFFLKKLELWKLKAQEKIITSEIYKHSRNPLYLGILIISIGSIMIFTSYAGFVGLVCVYLLASFQITKEEKGLALKFGNDYLNYKSSVRKWF